VRDIQVLFAGDRIAFMEMLQVGLQALFKLAVHFRGTFNIDRPGGLTSLSIEIVSPRFRLRQEVAIRNVKQSAVL
jgi:hypothetical protein